MSGFRLLAIRLLEGCDIDFHRVLKPLGTIYQFYNDYEFELKNPNDINSEVINIKSKDEGSELRLYDLDDLSINISALVGKNGSGKSSIIELFFAALFVAAESDGVLETNLKSLKKQLKDLHDQKILLKERREKFEKRKLDLKKHISYLEKNKHEINIMSIVKEFDQIHGINDSLINEESQINKEQSERFSLVNEITRLNMGLKVEFYYKINRTVYRLRISYNDKKKEILLHQKLNREAKNQEKLWEPINGKDKIKFDQFFYTIAISYSHYALNSKLVGDWVNPLFHKNDSYQTPLVINPMRIEGNIDVNTENELVRQRLLLNILEDIGENKPEESLRNLAPNKTANELMLEFNEKKISSYINTKHNSSNKYPSQYFLNNLFKQYAGDNQIRANEKIAKGLKFYIEHKLIRICENYDRYDGFIVKGKFTNSDKLIDKIILDNSHVTFKLKQAINQLIYGHYPIKDINNVFVKDLDTFSSFLEIGKTKAKEFKKSPSRIELLPPSIFKQSIKLTDESDLDDLSSGEKQLIHSISSIVYHIIYINSVAENGANKDEVISYKYVNILFDEVEQYFHPELQREFISKLLDYISKMNKNHFNNIKGINMLFATHSPFILSDIPKQNILRLEDGKPSDKEFSQTFAANIHELLHNDFFLENGFMGDFAKDRINEVIDFLRNKKWINERKEIEERINENKKKKLVIEDLQIRLDIIKLQQKRIKNLSRITKLDECEKIISLVGEPVLKESLTELYNEVLKIEKKV